MTRIESAIGATICAASIAMASGVRAADTGGVPARFDGYSGAYNWSGLYTGAFVGSAHSIWTIDFYRNNNHGHAELPSDGFAGGFWVGYNWQVSQNVVFGIEADIGWTGADQHNETFDNDKTDSEIGPFGSIRGRAGYAIDRVLFFATAGVAWANISQNIQKGRNAGEQVVWEDQTPTGYVVGAGIEYAFDNRWIGRAEYLYSNYGTVTLYNRDGNRAEFENDLSLVRVGLSHRF